MTLTVPRDARPGSELVLAANADWVVCEKEGCGDLVLQVRVTEDGDDYLVTVYMAYVP